MSQQGFRDLAVWQKSMVIVKSVYVLTKQFPKEELYGLSNQIRRAAVSIPSNIAEGKSRFSNKEFARFLLIARGSAAELETQLLISQDLAYADSNKIKPLMDNLTEVGKMISGLIAKLTSEG